jgi:hypothetical protein
MARPMNWAGARMALAPLAGWIDDDSKERDGGRDRQCSTDPQSVPLAARSPRDISAHIVLRRDFYRARLVTSALRVTGMAN